MNEVSFKAIGAVEHAALGVRALQRLIHDFYIVWLSLLGDITLADGATEVDVEQLNRGLFKSEQVKTVVNRI